MKNKILCIIFPLLLCSVMVDYVLAGPRWDEYSAAFSKCMRGDQLSCDTANSLRYWAEVEQKEELEETKKELQKYSDEASRIVREAYRRKGLTPPTISEKKSKTLPKGYYACRTLKKQQDSIISERMYKHLVSSKDCYVADGDYKVDVLERIGNAARVMIYSKNGNGREMYVDYNHLR